MNHMVRCESCKITNDSANVIIQSCKGDYIGLLCSKEDIVTKRETVHYLKLKPDDLKSYDSGIVSVNITGVSESLVLSSSINTYEIST